MITNGEGNPALDWATCDRARLARDRRYDGLFFTAVRTTGLYCRPIWQRSPLQCRLSEDLRAPALKSSTRRQARDSHQDRRAAVDGQDVAVDVGGGVLGEKYGGAGDLLRPSPTPHGRALLEISGDIRIGDPRRLGLGGEEARRDRVAGDAVRPELAGERGRANDAV